MLESDHKEGWVSKNWCFWTVLLKTPESPLDCKEIQPVHPKEITPEYSLEGLMLKLKLQYFGHLMQRADPLEKILMLGKTEGRRRRGRQRMASLTRWTLVWASSGSWWWTGKPGMLQSMGSELDTTERLNCTDAKYHFFLYCFVPITTEAGGWTLRITKPKCLWSLKG